MNYEKCFLYLEKASSYIGKIRQEALHEDKKLYKLADIFEKLKKISDYIYKKLP